MFNHGGLDLRGNTTALPSQAKQNNKLNSKFCPLIAILLPVQTIISRTQRPSTMKACHIKFCFFQTNDTMSKLHHINAIYSQDSWDIVLFTFLHEPPHGKTNNLHMRKQRRLCFRYTDSTIPLLLKSEISSF